jgi:hypothetical protein
MKHFVSNVIKTSIIMSALFGCSKTFEAMAKTQSSVLGAIDQSSTSAQCIQAEKILSHAPSIKGQSLLEQCDDLEDSTDSRIMKACAIVDNNGCAK